jgi:hypothetical protein
LQLFSGLFSQKILPMKARPTPAKKMAYFDFGVQIEVLVLQ